MRRGLLLGEISRTDNENENETGGAWSLLLNHMRKAEPQGPVSTLAQVLQHRYLLTLLSLPTDLAFGSWLRQQCKIAPIPSKLSCAGNICRDEAAWPQEVSQWLPTMQAEARKGMKPLPYTKKSYTIVHCDHQQNNL